MGFMTVIKAMINIVIITILTLVGRIVVFPHVKILLSQLPPTTLWHPVARIFFSVLFALFYISMTFLLIMYVIYIIIKRFVPNFPIPLKKILLALTPFYELRVSGVFPLFDAVLGIIFSRDSFGNRLIRLGRAIGMFLASSIFYLTPKSKSKPKAAAPKKPPPPKEGEFNDNDTTENEPDYDETMSLAENKYVQKEFQQCISENYKPINDKMSEEEKTYASVSNATSKIICDIKKLQSYSTLISSKYL